MNFSELTRNCFQGGIPAPKWLALCRKLVEKNPTSQSHETLEASLSNSILALFPSYPGDSDLHGYFKCAIQGDMLSLAMYVTTFLQASRSPELHTISTLDMLCRIALEAHYASGIPAIGSIISYSDTPATVLNKIQDALALLRTAYTLPISHFHQLITSVSQLLVLLLSCVPDLSQISNTQAAMHYADVNDLLMNFRLEPDVRQMLESFAISLSISMGDDVKAAREAQMIQAMQLHVGKTDVQGSDADVITFSLIFHQWIARRGHDHGTGNTNDAVALFIAVLRWTAWSPNVFYTQLLVTAIMCLAQNRGASMIWRAFITGRLPSLLSAFELAIKSDSTSQGDWRIAMQTAFSTLFRRPDLIVECEHNLSRAMGKSGEDLTRSFTRELLQSFVKHELLDYSFAIQLDPTITNENSSRLHAEAQDIGTDIGSFLESKLSTEVDVLDACKWVSRVWQDPVSQHAFASVVMKRFTLFTTSLDADGLSHLSKILYTSEVALDILSLHVRLTEIVFRALRFLEDYDCETVGDPRAAVSHLGDVILLVQYIVVRYQLNPSSISMSDQKMSATYLFCYNNAQDPMALPTEDALVFTSWYKTLFDSNSEGIEDTILRSTPPRVLLRLSTSLVIQALRSKLDNDVLNNGISYFTSPLLNWTLFTVVRGILREFESTKAVITALVDVLQTFILSPSCPRPVVLLCKDQIYGLLSLKRIKSLPNFNIAALRDAIDKITGQKSVSLDIVKDQPANPYILEDESRQAIHQAFTSASAQKAPSLNVERCLKLTSPTKFLRQLWSEMLVSGSMRETETCRRLATFVLAVPRSSEIPPLLPMFLHVVLPSLIHTLDGQPPAEQNVNLDILVTIISSALTAAAHLDWAVRTVSGEHKPTLGQHSPAMVRQLAAELKSQKQSHSGKLFAQKLASSHNFVSNFPFFVTELNA